MEKKELKRIGTYVGIILIVGAIIILSFKGCKKKPVENPAVSRLETINDSLLKVIDKNTKAANDAGNRDSYRDWETLINKITKLL